MLRSSPILTLEFGDLVDTAVSEQDPKHYWACFDSLRDWFDVEGARYILHVGAKEVPQSVRVMPHALDHIRVGQMGATYYVYKTLRDLVGEGGYLWVEELD